MKEENTPSKAPWLWGFKIQNIDFWRGVTPKKNSNTASAKEPMHFFEDKAAYF